MYFVGMILVLLLFIGIPFGLGIVLPSWLVPWGVKKYIERRTNHKLPSFFPLTVYLIILATIINIFWNKYIFLHLYYKWDDGWVPFSYLGHEGPRLDLSSSWLAPGWQTWHLDLVWIGLCLLCYGLALAWYWLPKRRQFSGAEAKRLKQALLSTVAVLAFMSAILPYLLAYVFGFIFSLGGPREIKQACPVVDFESPQIVYERNNKYFISDLEGKNLHELLDRDALAYNFQQTISPDQAKIVREVGQDFVWVYCLHGKGRNKISLPESKLKKRASYEPRSSLSWSPDSQQFVMNFEGDLTIVDTETEKSRILKSQVALKDNHIDITAKDKQVGISPFEVGDAYWGRSGHIYYTTFNEDFSQTAIHELNLATNLDRELLSSTYVLRIAGGSPDAKWLMISESEWQGEKSDPPFTEEYLFNIETGEKRKPWAGVGTGYINNLQWSPDSQYILLHKSGSWRSSPVLEGFPALMYRIEDNYGHAVTWKAEAALKKLNIHFANKAVVVSTVGMAGPNQVILDISFMDQKSGHHDKVIGILNVETQELKIIHRDLNASKSALGDQLEAIGVLY
jgi:hypothetical protein